MAEAIYWSNSDTTQETKPTEIIHLSERKLHTLMKEEPDTLDAVLRILSNCGWHHIAGVPEKARALSAQILACSHHN